MTQLGKRSSGEILITRLLQEAKIKFEIEKSFKDCGFGYFRFDFYLPQLNCVVEANGQQHYEFAKIFHKKKSDFTKAQERDRQKICYCLANEIKIYCIPYWELNNLKTAMDLFNDKFLATSKFHNDLVYRQYKLNEK